MHITLESDYAVRIVHCLAKNARRIDAKSIAEETGVTLRFSLKILHKLVSSGIVRSYKGTRGGYELARRPEEISLGDVIEVVEGPFTLSRCLAPDFKCSCDREVCSRGDCKFQKVYDEISEMVREKLSSVKFSDINE